MTWNCFVEVEECIFELNYDPEEDYVEVIEVEKLETANLFINQGFGLNKELRPLWNVLREKAKEDWKEHNDNT